MNGTVEDPLAWRSFADGDLQTARILIEREDVEALAHITAFHAHQSAEKYLKGTIALHERKEPPKIHNLRQLLTVVARHEPDLETPYLENATLAMDYTSEQSCRSRTRPRRSMSVAVSPVLFRMAEPLPQ